MGNSSKKQTTMPQEGAASFHKLEEEITCSVCLCELKEPVSITCGHTFCRPCISSYWSAPQLLGYRCPECRKVCPRDQLIPVHRLKTLVTKVQLVVKQEQARKESPAQAIPLVYTGGDGKLQLDESAIQCCFMDSAISNYPACLICVIGEKRRGKSFLMNYILRALHSQEKGEPLSLGTDDEPLSGFEWKAGTEGITKGIWIWNKPFIVERDGEKMAVFVLDSEGSLDIEGCRETCIKLSALSMVLSSYLIFNVNSSLKSTELDYLEMYLHISELTGKSFSLQYLQHLDILIRDWHDCENCSKEDARAYIKRETERLRKTNEYPRVLDTLRSPSVTCCLLPHPGKGFLRSDQGKLSDMDEDFRGQLTTYICDLVKGVRRHLKTDINEEKVTCSQLERILKEFVRILQKEEYSFKSPLEMFFSFENYKNMEKVKNKFKEYMDNAAPKTSSPFKILGVLPSKMKSKFSSEVPRFLQMFQDSMVCNDDTEKLRLSEEMNSLLLEEQEKFCAEYSKRFTKCAVGIGCAVGGGVLSLAGGVVGAAVAGTVLATEAVALLGSTTAAMVTGAVGGSLTLGAIGGGVGAGVGGAIAKREKKKERAWEEGDICQGSADDKQGLVTHQEKK
ncbi:RING finger protein 112-like [Rhinophrynus dorsalis]